MNGKDMKAIREGLGWSLADLADYLYYGDLKALRKMELGQKDISGPIRRCLEILRDGAHDSAADSADGQS